MNSLRKSTAHDDGSTRKELENKAETAACEYCEVQEKKGSNYSEKVANCFTQ